MLVTARSIGHKWHGPWLVVGGRWMVGGGPGSTHWTRVTGAQLKTQTKTHLPPTKSHGYIGHVVLVGFGFGGKFWKNSSQFA